MRQSKSTLSVIMSFYKIKEIQLQPPGEPREHHLGEVLQGRTKSKFNIAYYLLFFKYSFSIHLLLVF